MTGAGKSEFVQDLMFQTEPYFGYDVIVEEGASHAAYTKAHGCSPLVIHPDGSYTINYLDTHQQPLSAIHLAYAGSLVMHMAGRIRDERLAQARLAQVNQYINLLYQDSYADWSKRNPDLADRAKIEACAAYHWQRLKMAPDATGHDAFVALRDGLANQDDEICSFVANQSPEAVLSFCKNPSTSRLFVNYSFRYFSNEEYPTHIQLCELMAASPLPEHPIQDIYEMSSLLRNWSASEGSYGKLFDGITNTRLDSRVVHFELAQIPDAMPELKSAVALLMMGFVRQLLLNMPRNVRKRCVFEEMARFLTVPDAGKLLQESAAQYRKYNVWSMYIVQQYSQFSQTDVCPVIMGNCSQFFIMKQQFPPDIASIGDATALPGSMRETVAKYPLIDDLPEGGKYSSVCYHMRAKTPPISGTLRHTKLL